MNMIINNLLAQGSPEWLENLIGVAVVALAVIGHLANAWINNIKEKKKREKELSSPLPKPKPPASRQPLQPARPLPPTRPRPQQLPTARPAQEAQPPRPARTLGIPRELLPEGLGEIIAEVAPELVRPKPRPPASPPVQRPPVRPPIPERRPSPKPPPRPVEPKSERPADSSERLGTLTSSIEDEAPTESTVAAHVESHMTRLDHPVEDAEIGAATQARRVPSRAALRHAIIMSEIISPPLALRPIEHRF